MALEATLDPLDDTGLGVLSDTGARVVRRSDGETKLTPEARAFLLEPEPLIITKSNERSLVHRRANMDYVGVRLYDSKGRLSGERRFVGLFTSSAYSRRPDDIPLLRLKAEHVRLRAGLAPDSHDGKALAHIIDSFPRDEMFQVSEDELFATALGILRLGERPKVRAFLRFDRFDRFVSAFVYVPRDRYSTAGARKDPRHPGKALSRTAVCGAADARRQHAGARPLHRRSRGQARGRMSTFPRSNAKSARAIRTWDDGFLRCPVEAPWEIAKARASSAAMRMRLSAALSRRLHARRGGARS